MFTNFIKGHMFKSFECHELFPDTPCCDDAENERFCFMRNDPASTYHGVLRVEVHSCCKHSHDVKRLPIEFYLKHHVPYVEERAVSKEVTKEQKEIKKDKRSRMDDLLYGDD